MRTYCVGKFQIDFNVCDLKWKRFSSFTIGDLINVIRLKNRIHYLEGITSDRRLNFTDINYYSVLKINRTYLCHFCALYLIENILNVMKN